ncbi:MAG TPA: glycosyltransferase family 4 protein [Cellulomonas sp.]
MTRVALVASSYAPYVGGVEEHVRHVAAGLRARGHHVVVWTVDRGEGDTFEVIDGVPVRRLPTPMPARSVGAAVRFVLRAPGAWLRWRRALRQDRPDVINVQCFGPNGIWATQIAQVSRRRLVVSSHGETYGDADDVFARSALLRRSLVQALREADAITGCSEHVVRDLERRFGLEPGRGVVVPNGVDLDEPAGTPPEGLPARYLLAVGRLVRTKGFDLLLDAFAAAGLPGVDLVIGGVGPERAALARQASALGVGERVHLPGRLERGAVVSTMAGAVALVVPSRVEPFGIVVLEGWRAAVPVVVTAEGGPADIVTDGVDGLVVDPEDTAALTAALRLVATDAEAAGRMGAAGRLAVTTYTWQRVVADYEALYAHRAAEV